MTRDGFTNYVAAFASVLHAHHSTEDELFFPYARNKSLDAPYENLTAQHQEMIPLLNKVKTTVEEMKTNDRAVEALKKLNQVTTTISAIWHPHIRAEEDHFSAEKLGAVMTVEEQVSLDRRAAEHSQKHASPDFLVAPFLLYNLPPEYRVLFAEAIPPIVTQQLVPIVWKEKWASMKPFLLA